MKKIKLFGLAVVAALALAVLGGAGTASATVLCNAAPEGKGTEAPCPSGHVLPAGTEITMYAPKLTFSGNPLLGNLVCGGENGGSYLTFRTTQTSAQPLPAELQRLLFRGCSYTGSGTSCTFSEASGGTLNFQSSGKGSGTVSLENGPEFQMLCGGSVSSCRYRFSFGTAPFTGGLPGVFALNEAPITRTVAEYGSCPETLKVSGQYQVTGSSTSLWLAYQ